MLGKPTLWAYLPPGSLWSDFKMFPIIQDIFCLPGREEKSLQSRPHMGTRGNMVTVFQKTLGQKGSCFANGQI